jgi:hypothetical protein
MHWLSEIHCLPVSSSRISVPTGALRRGAMTRSAQLSAPKEVKLVVRRFEFPFTLRLPMPFGVQVYPSAEGAVGVKVRGQGHCTLTLERTEDPNIAKVRFEDIFVKLPPTRIPFDVDRDGQLECVDIEGLELGAEAFDLKKSGGNYDLRNGQIVLSFIFSLSSQALMPMSEKLGLKKPIGFEIVESGWLDLETGRCRTHSGVFTIPEGPFAGMTVTGCNFSSCDDQCQDTLHLGVGVYSSALLGVSAADAPNAVYICPKTPIALLWESNAPQVDIAPDVGAQKSKGYQLIPDPVSSNAALKKPLEQTGTYTYTADTSHSDCLSAHASVSVTVISEGFETAQTAYYDPEYKYWYAYLPPNTYDENIKVAEVVIQSSAFSKPDSVTLPKWRVDHIYPPWSPVGTQIPALDHWTNTASLYCLPGEYKFTPMLSGASLPAGEQKRIVYFKLRTRCTL